MPHNIVMLAVDTLKAYEGLIAADLTEAQARAILEVVKTAHEAWLERLATKEEFARSEVATKVRFEQLEAAINARFEKSEAAFNTRFEQLEAAMNARFEKSEAATNAGFALVRSEMKETEARLEAKIAIFKSDVLKWFITLLLGQTAFLVGVIKFLK
jgi:chaperonin cofactor prefoldin